MAVPTFPPESIEVLLFDLGGVVVDIDFGRCLSRWALLADSDVDEVTARFSFDAAYERHERGEIQIGEYLQSLRRTLALELPDDDLLAGWNDIYVGVSTGVAPLLVAAGEVFPLHAFTNSNPTHQAVWTRRFPDALGVFTSIHVSSEIGLRKPEPAAFAHVASAIGAAPQNILFFDDSPENVLGARDAGLHAVHVTSTDSVRAALADLDITASC